MKARIIKIHLNNILNDFADSIDDLAIKELVEKNSIITGGAIASLLMKEKPNDYDIYFRDRTTALRVAEYYVNKFNKDNPDSREKAEVITHPEDSNRIEIFVKSDGVASEGNSHLNVDFNEDLSVKEADDIASAKDGEKYRPIFLSANAITLTNKIQLVIRFYGEPEEIHKNYDYVHCTSYWTPLDNNLVLPPAALEALLAKELVYVGSLYPVASLVRIKKFVQRGFTINAGQILKICMDLNDLNLNDINTLRDQLTGVDTYYFNELLSNFKDSNRIDKNYLINIINKMF